MGLSAACSVEGIYDTTIYPPALVGDIRAIGSGIRHRSCRCKKESRLSISMERLRTNVSLLVSAKIRLGMSPLEIM